MYRHLKCCKPIFVIECPCDRPSILYPTPDHLTSPQDCLFAQKVDVFGSHLQASSQLLFHASMGRVTNLGGGHSMSSDHFGRQHCQSGTTTRHILTCLPSSAPMSGSQSRTDSMHIGWTTRPGSLLEIITTWILHLITRHQNFQSSSISVLIYYTAFIYFNFASLNWEHYFYI